MNMLYLLELSPIKPDIGLLFWSTIAFCIFWFMLGKFAFGPIKDALKKRDGDIKEALDKAEEAKAQISNLQDEHKALLVKAQEERALILKEANDTKNAIVAEAKNKAKSETDRLLTNAKQEIENEKKKALMEVKNTVGAMAISIAEKVIKKELASDANQTSFVNQLVDDINLN